MIEFHSVNRMVWTLYLDEFEMKCYVWILCSFVRIATLRDAR